jgi:hypothetical protein
MVSTPARMAVLPRGQHLKMASDLHVLWSG